MLPPSYFKLLAEQTPIAVFKGRVFQVGNGIGGSNYLNLGGVRYPLLELETIAKLERIYMENNEEQIELLKEQIIKKELESVKLSKKELYEIGKENKLLSFIINEIFPLVLEDDKDFETLVSKREGKKDEEKEDYLHKLMKEAGIEAEVPKSRGRKQKENKEKTSRPEDPFIEEPVQFQKRKSRSSEPLSAAFRDDNDIRDIEILLEITRGKKDTKYLIEEGKEMPPEDDEIKKLLMNYARDKRELQPSVLTNNVLGNKNILCLKDIVYDLIEGRGRDRQNIMINDSQYFLYPLTSLSSLENNYMHALEQKIKETCLEENDILSEKVERIEREKELMKNFLEKDEFCKDNLGFAKEGSDYYVYVRIPEFVLKHPETGGLYHFNGCRVGVKITYRNDMIGFENTPRVLERYSHPFIKDSGSLRQTICMGNYSYDNAVRGLDKAHAIVKLLSDAKQVITSGYLLGVGPHHKLEDMSRHRISEEEVRDKGLQITNILVNPR